MAHARPRRPAGARSGAPGRGGATTVPDHQGHQESGPMLEEALAAGIAAGGGDAMLGGALPTPAASVLTRRLLRPRRRRLRLPQPLRRQRDKFFGAAGTKLDDESEAAIEPCSMPRPGRGRPRWRALEGAFDDYIRELRTRSPSISRGCGSRSTAPTGRPTGRRRRSSPLGRRSRRSATNPTAATSISTAGRPPEGPDRAGPRERSRCRLRL